jgi:hypothetical protein
LVRNGQGKKKATPILIRMNASFQERGFGSAGNGERGGRGEAGWAAAVMVFSTSVARSRIRRRWQGQTAPRAAITTGSKVLTLRVTVTGRTVFAPNAVWSSFSGTLGPVDAHSCSRMLSLSNSSKGSKMKRRMFDVLVSATGLLIALILLVAGGLLTWAHNFVSDQVHTQLAAQQIYFPPADSAAVAGDAFAPMRAYAGQQLTTGAQAETYADHFIAIHLQAIGGGKTYSQLSAESQASPTDLKLAATVNTVFKGETLRGLLLNAYAFGTMATIAGIAAISAFVAALVMLVLGGLGLRHARRVPPATDVVIGHRTADPVPVG